MIDVLGPEKRRRRTTQEKIAIVQQSFEPGMTVSLVARGWGVSLVSRCLRVSRAQLHVILRRPDDTPAGALDHLPYRCRFTGGAKGVHFANSADQW